MHREVEAGITVVLAQAKELRSHHQALEETKKGSPLQRKFGPADTFISYFWSLHL